MASVRMRKYSEGKTNAHSVQIGLVELYFSYETCIAFDDGHERVISENVWSTTTGRHLNAICDDKSIRLPNAEFQKRLSALTFA